MGEASSVPHVRKVPMSKDGFKKPLSALLTSRQCSEPAAIQVGDIYTRMDAGKDRKRVFTTPLKFGKPRFRSIVVHCTEDSARQRGRKCRVLKLTQHFMMLYNPKTDIPHREYKVFSGSNYGDVLGPVALEGDLPKLSRGEKLLCRG